MILKYRLYNFIVLCFFINVCHTGVLNRNYGQDYHRLSLNKPASNGQYIHHPFFNNYRRSVKTTPHHNRKFGGNDDYLKYAAGSELRHPIINKYIRNVKTTPHHDRKLGRNDDYFKYRARPEFKIAKKYPFSRSYSPYSTSNANGNTRENTTAVWKRNLKIFLRNISDPDVNLNLQFLNGLNQDVETVFTDISTSENKEERDIIDKYNTDNNRFKIKNNLHKRDEPDFSKKRDVNPYINSAEYVHHSQLHNKNILRFYTTEIRKKKRKSIESSEVTTNANESTDKFDVEVQTSENISSENSSYFENGTMDSVATTEVQKREQKLDKNKEHKNDELSIISKIITSHAPNLKRKITKYRKGSQNEQQIGKATKKLPKKSNITVTTKIASHKYDYGFSMDSLKNGTMDSVATTEVQKREQKLDKNKEHNNDELSIITNNITSHAPNLKRKITKYRKSSQKEQQIGKATKKLPNKSNTTVKTKIPSHKHDKVENKTQLKRKMVIRNDRLTFNSDKDSINEQNNQTSNDSSKENLVAVKNFFNIFNSTINLYNIFIRAFIKKPKSIIFDKAPDFEKYQKNIFEEARKYQSENDDTENSPSKRKEKYSSDLFHDMILKHVPNNFSDTTKKYRHDHKPTIKSHLNYATRIEKHDKNHDKNSGLNKYHTISHTSPDQSERLIKKERSKSSNKSKGKFLKHKLNLSANENLKSLDEVNTGSLLANKKTVTKWVTKSYKLINKKVPMNNGEALLMTTTSSNAKERKNAGMKNHNFKKMFKSNRNHKKSFDASISSMGRNQRKSLKKVNLPKIGGYESNNTNEAEQITNSYALSTISINDESRDISLNLENSFNEPDSKNGSKELFYSTISIIKKDKNELHTEGNTSIFDTEAHWSDSTTETTVNIEMQHKYQRINLDNYQKENNTKHSMHQSDKKREKNKKNHHQFTSNKPLIQTIISSADNSTKISTTGTEGARLLRIIESYFNESKSKNNSQVSKSLETDNLSTVSTKHEITSDFNHTEKYHEKRDELSSVSYQLFSENDALITEKDSNELNMKINSSIDDWNDSTLYDDTTLESKYQTESVNYQQEKNEKNRPQSTQNPLVPKTIILRDIFDDETTSSVQKNTPETSTDLYKDEVYKNGDYIRQRKDIPEKLKELVEKLINKRSYEDYNGSNEEVPRYKRQILSVAQDNLPENKDNILPISNFSLIFIGLTVLAVLVSFKLITDPAVYELHRNYEIKV